MSDNYGLPSDDGNVFSREWDITTLAVKHPDFSPLGKRTVCVILLCNPSQLPDLPAGWDEMEAGGGLIADSADSSWPEALGQVLGGVAALVPILTRKLGATFFDRIHGD